MAFSLYWSKTGDTIDLSPVQPDILEWWIDRINEHGCNQFQVTQQSTLQEQIKTLQVCVDSVNAYWKQHFKKEFFQYQDLVDQREINDLHRAWVLIQKNKPNLLMLLDKMDPAVCQTFLSINKLLHNIETNWKWEFHPKDNGNWKVSNPFGAKYNIWYRSNISIDYGNLGRSVWEKYSTWGKIDDEYNEMEMLSGVIHVGMQRSGTIEPGTDFQTWCRENQVSCYPDLIPLADFVALEKYQHRYRRIFIDNLTLDNNYLTLFKK